MAESERKVNAKEWDGSGQEYCEKSTSSCILSMSEKDGIRQ